MADDLNYRPPTPQEIAAQQSVIDRQRKIAEYLQQQSFQEPQGQMVSGHYVPAGFTQNLSRLAQGLIGKTQQEALDKKQAPLLKEQGDLLYKMVGGAVPDRQNSNQPAIIPNTPDAQTSPVPSNNGVTVNPLDDQGKLKAIAERLIGNNAPAMPQQSGSTGSLLIPGMSPSQAFTLYNNDQKGYLGSFLKQFEPTDLQRNDRYLGITPEQTRASELAKRTKEGMYEQQPGSTSTNLQTGVKTFQPKVGEGINVVDGVASPLPGYSAANAEIKGKEAGATAEANAGFKLIDVDTPTGKVKMTEKQAADYAQKNQGGGNQQPISAQQNGFPTIAPSEQAARDRTALLYARADIDNARNPADKAQAEQAYKIIEARVNAGQSPITGSAKPSKQSIPGIPLQSEADAVTAKKTAEKNVEKQFDQPKEQFSLSGSTASIDAALKQINYLKNNPALENITGTFASKLPNVTGKANNVQADLDTLKSQIGAQVLNEMRAASKTGGAVGNVTEKEWPILQNQMGALQQTQTTEQFRKRLGDVEQTLNRVKDSYKTEYSAKYPAAAPAQSTSNGGWGIRRLP